VLLFFFLYLVPSKSLTSMPVADFFGWSICAIWIIVAIPQATRVIMTKNTYSYSIYSVLALFGTAAAWFSFSICDEFVLKTTAQFAYIVADTIVLTGNTILLIYKLININRAKKTKLTERAYYEKHIFPKLNHTVRDIFYFD
jgi:uncharacterized protein with PQ loop repeat